MPGRTLRLEPTDEARTASRKSERVSAFAEHSEGSAMMLLELVTATTAATVIAVQEK